MSNNSENIYKKRLNSRQRSNPRTKSWTENNNNNKIKIINIKEESTYMVCICGVGFGWLKLESGSEEIQIGLSHVMYIVNSHRTSCKLHTIVYKLYFISFILSLWFSSLYQVLVSSEHWTNEIVMVTGALDHTRFIFIGCVGEVFAYLDGIFDSSYRLDTYNSYIYNGSNGTGTWSDNAIKLVKPAFL